MASTPTGDPVPLSGELPTGRGAGSAPLGVYLHVPFCRTRCGYCDFNTYTARELASDAGRVGPDTYAELVVAELELARRVLGKAAPAVSTVFVGGGTPNLLSASAIAQMLAGVRDAFGMAGDAEVTVEANPDAVVPGQLEQLREAGVNRVSFGMQSASQHVLAVLERTHTPGATAAAVAGARAAGFESVSVDLIYGTPGESLADWRHSVESALELQVDHVSAYALIVEDGTRLATAVRSGRSAAPDDDLMAEMYLLADDLLTGAGLGWYELSNWAVAGQECRHNVGYWLGHDWWGAGPGAHSHVDGVRWWNRKHPAAWASCLARAESPGAAREVLTPQDVELERLLLQARLASGVQLSGAHQLRVGRQLVEEGLVEAADGSRSRVVLTRTGRLLADAVVRRLG